MKFTFTEDMIIVALLANGWGRSWNSDEWYHKDLGNPDYVSLTTKEAFERLLFNCNTIPKDVNKCWS
jgi:hypothetical protein